MLWQRILTAIIGIPFAFAVVYWGRLPFFLTVTFLSLFGLREYFRIIQGVGAKPYHTLGYLTGSGLLASTYFKFSYNPFEFFLLFFLFGGIFFIANYGKRDLRDFALSFLGVFYVAGLFTYLLLIRNHFTNGFLWVILTLVLIWCNDSGAYFVGRKFGKHKLHELVSPKKTIEGAVGGILITILAALVLNYFFNLFPAMHGIILAIFVAVAGILGDLWESALKREAGIKDSGLLLPGHGGILDRFDSLLFALPVVYYYLRGFIID